MPRETAISIARKARTQSPTLLQLAWAAGIFEGEGYARRVGRYTRVLIVQKDRWLIDELHRLFGGNTYNVKNRDQRMNYWEANGARARGFLMTIFLWLSPRRRVQVRRALEV